MLSQRSEPVDERVAHFADLERFMSHWQSDPYGFCNFVGRAIGRIGHRNLQDLLFAIGASYFAFRCLPDRIDYLYNHHHARIGGEKGSLIASMLGIELVNDVVCIHDKSGNHGHVRVMLLRDEIDGHQSYSLRYFVKEGTASGYLREHWDQKNRGRPTFKRVAAQNEEPPPTYEQEYEFWNFRRPEELTDGVIVYPHASGFFDLWETKSVGDLVVLASNLVGFRC
ncbi:MAG: hypothetical protein ACXAC5_01500 [Promethearchaeota archaeon]|jgi:hypothetical protein